MKNHFLLVMLLACGSLKAQNSGQISQASAQRLADELHIHFTVSSEANVRQYVIEASTDSIQYEIIGTLPSKGNTVIWRSYEFVGYNLSYPYCRVKQMGFDGTIMESIKIHTILTPEPSAER
jgi:hypothetical protein